MNRHTTLAAATLLLMLPAGASHAKNCELFGSAKSINSNVPITVTFNNTSGAFRHVTWLDYNGRPVAYHALNPGQSAVQQTYAGHPWMTTDGPGNCVDIYIPKKNRTINLR